MLALGLVMVPAADTAFAQGVSIAGPPARPPFAPNAQEDDWAYLADADRRTEDLDRIKHIPLGDGGASYAYVGGQFRVIARIYDDENFGARPGTDDTYHRRTMLHGGIVIEDRVRFFAELKHGGVTGEQLPLGSVEEDELDLHQAFVEGRFGANRQHRVRVGRQELHYGRGLLVSVREGPNVRASHDGGLLRVQVGAWRVDAFIVQPVTSRSGAFDDRREPGARLSALYAAGKLDDGAEVDVYYFCDRRLGRQYDNASGNETRHTLGARYGRRFLHWSFDAEAAVQLGELTEPLTGIEESIRAWTVYGRVERKFDGALAPAFALEGGVASGDRRRRDSTLNTFRAPQPPGRYFGNTTPLGPGNLAGFTPSISLGVAPRTRLTLQSRFFWRLSTDDGLYSPPGFLIKRGDLSRERFVGREVGATVAHQIDRHLTVSATVARFGAGKFLRETPPGRSVGLAEAMLAYHF
jgi:hypothetical protein